MQGSYYLRKYNELLNVYCFISVNVNHIISVYFYRWYLAKNKILSFDDRYTREAGVRSLDRKFGAICRAVAVKVAEGQHKEAKLDRYDVAEGEGL